MSFRRPRFRRAGAAVLAVAMPAVLAVLPANTASSSALATSQASPRGVDVVRPVTEAATRKVLWTSGHPERGSTYLAGCGTPVVATHPGVAIVNRRPGWGKRNVVKVTTQNGLLTSYRYLGNTQVTDGQLIQAGQQLGTVARGLHTTRCQMTMHVNTGGRVQHAVFWVRYWLDKPVPIRAMLRDPGFEVASFNILGANHTDSGGSKASWPNYDKRIPGTIELLERYGVDVAGLQELQWRQRTMFLNRTGDTWGIYPSGQNDNSIIWRKSEFGLVEGGTFKVPYFNGHLRDMPYVLLKDRDTNRTAYFISVHNPTTNKRWGNQDKWRYEAVRRERQKVIDLRAQGRPVFLTGDFNDRARAFCPLTRDKLMISPDSIPSMTCRMPEEYYWVDWIFAAGQSRFTTLTVDTSPRARKISDHPLVVGTAHMQN